MKTRIIIQQGDKELYRDYDFDEDTTNDKLGEIVGEMLDTLMSEYQGEFDEDLGARADLEFAINEGK